MALVSFWGIVSPTNIGRGEHRKQEHLRKVNELKEKIEEKKKYINSLGTTAGDFHPHAP